MQVCKRIGKWQKMNRKRQERHEENINFLRIVILF